MRTPLALLWFLASAATASAQGLEFYPNLRQRLALSDAQWERITESRRAYQTRQGQAYDRLGQVNRELLAESLRDQPDPAALGVRHLEIAGICKEATGWFASYREELRRVLDETQRARLAEMEVAMGLLPAMSEGQSLGLLGQEVKSALPPGLQAADLPIGWLVSQTYGISLLAGCPWDGRFAITGAFAYPVSQALYPNLARHLDLTEDQFTRIVNLEYGTRSDLSQRREEAASLRREIQAESAQPMPDVSVLGAKAARLEQVCRESIGLEKDLQKALPAILNDQQRAKWQELERALQLLPALSESQQLSLTARVPDNARPPFLLADRPLRRVEWNVSYTAGSSLPGCEADTTGLARWFNTTAFVTAQQPKQ
ncbi:MAG: hypothetical protein U0Q16_32670 [Bryobacteraceae bacterium]